MEKGCTQQRIFAGRIQVDARFQQWQIWERGLANWRNPRIVRQIEDGRRLNRFVRLWTASSGIG
jgi:hypothetical protein